LFAIHGGRPCCSPCCNHVVCHLSWWTTMLPSCCLPSMVNDHVRCGACNYVVCHPWWTTMLFAMLQSCCLSFVMVDYLSLSLSLHTHTHTHTHTAVPCVYVCVWAPNYFPPLFPLATLGFFDGVFAHNNIVIKKFGICGV